MSMHIGFKLTDAEGESSRGFIWPDSPGTEMTAMAGIPGGPCPMFQGDGLCIARTIQGAQSGGQPFQVMTLVAWDDDDVLGEDSTKVRVSRCVTVTGRFDLVKQVRRGDWAGADLSDADLRYANLRCANLSDANLRYANLRYANLYGANLRCADLSGADLSGADLSDANLRYANLYGANLRYANLSGANLSDADLRCANLSGAKTRKRECNE